MKFAERPQWGVWVTPKMLRQRPIYRWYVYPHSFDKELVLALLEELQVRRGEWIWDPFVGAGTTLLSCREYGCSALGTDLLPLSILVTRAKLAKYNRDRLAEELQHFSFGLPSGITDRFAPVPIVRKAFQSERRRQISYILDQIDTLPEGSKLFFRVALLRSMEELGLAIKSGGWLRIDPNRNLESKTLRALFRSHTEAMLDDLGRQAERQSDSVDLKARVGDARRVTCGQTISACITSPPYLNRHDYTRVFALELALLAVSSPRELISLRYKTLRSHVEARAPTGIKKNRPALPAAVPTIVSAVKGAGVNNSRVPEMIAGYFEDMGLVMRNIARNLASGGKAALVVGNTRFSGIMIPVDEILMEMAPTVGLQPVRVFVTRRRGNSAQQMGAYGRDPARESVLILKKRK